MKNPTSAQIVLDGFVTRYNIFLKHDILNNQTLAMVWGIGDGINNWGDLIELSINGPKYNPIKHIDWGKKFGIS